MQWLVNVCVKRPVFTWVLTLAMVVFGIAGLRTLGVDRYPDIQIPYVVVTTFAPGASPQQVETDVTDRIEEAVNTVAGLERLDSLSIEGLSVVSAGFVLDRDVSQAAQDVRDRVSRAMANLPPSVRAPRVEAFNPNSAPVLTLALWGPRTMQELTELARTTVRRRLESLPGVGDVSLLGGQERQVQVTLDLARLEQNGITVADVSRVVAASNVEAPGGALEQGDRVVPLRVLARADRRTELARIVLARHDDVVVHLGDVATIEDAPPRVHRPSRSMTACPSSRSASASARAPTPSRSSTRSAPRSTSSPPSSRLACRSA